MAGAVGHPERILGLYTGPPFPWPSCPDPRSAAVGYQALFSAWTLRGLVHIFPNRRAARSHLLPRRAPGMSQSCVPFQGHMAPAPACSKQKPMGRWGLVGSGQQCHVSCGLCHTTT